MTIDCRLGFGETNYCGDQCKFGCFINSNEKLPAEIAELPENYAGMPRQNGKQKNKPEVDIRESDSPKGL